MMKDKILERLNSLFKEEMWGRLEPKDIGISKFKILDDLFNNIVSEGVFRETQDECKQHIEENPNSVSASYLLGTIGYHIGAVEDTVYLRRLIDLFSGHHKWAVVERISEKILEYGENRIALKALATSLERLGKNKEAIPVWESLLKIDRFDAEVSKKLAYALIDDDLDKSIQYMKLSIEGFIKTGEFNEVGALWNKLVSITEDDIQFFERIERMLIEAKQHELTAVLLKSLLNKYRDEQNPDQSIEILKRILEYMPDDNSSRRELVRFYEKKYGEHSQYQQFLKLSKLNNLKYPVKTAIPNFERNIIFDKGNYVFHRSWWVGKIVDIDSESVTIDFKEKFGHKMTIQMALQSLQPLSKDHIYAMQYEDPETINALFEEDFMQFFEILIRSYEYQITLGDIKKELIPKFVDIKSWAKWWNKKRTEIKKDPHFAFSEKKKDLIFMRDKPVTFADELLDRFTKAPSFSERLNYAIEFVNNIEVEEGGPVAPYFVDYYTGQVKESSATKQVLSYFILRSLTEYVDSKKLKLDSIKEKVIDLIKHDSQALAVISIKISSYDYKKDFVNLIEETREDWPSVVSEILFETPVRIHKYIFNNLIRAHEYNILNGFIDRVITGAKQYPEIFLWVSKNILTRSWDYDWIDYSKDRLIITYFRLMSELKKIETKGNRLKNMAVETLYDNDMSVLSFIVEQSSQPFLGKVYDVFANIPYIEESQLLRFYDIIRAKYPDFKQATSKEESDEWELDVEKLIVSKEGYEKMKRELERMKSDMMKLSTELRGAADVAGDVRENVEYNRLMENQQILKMSINKLEVEMEKAEILDLSSVSTEAVNVGTHVTFEIVGTGEKNNYVILGPWDADFEKNVLSYRSPIAQALMGKKAGEEVIVAVGEESKQFKILKIEAYIKST
ncbi:MAG TPA: transcription elongation factor GreA [Spirochaetota bacterium]|nr:transcription elongation factor GreA [Spirochaetota bacterium]